MSSILSLSDLSSYCEDISFASALSFPELTQYFDSLFATGCRASELSKLVNWSDNGSTGFNFQPLKRNNIRFIPYSSLSSSLVAKFQDNNFLFPVLTGEYIDRWFRFFRAFPIFTCSKEVSASAFRYRFIKNLHFSGLSDTEIMVITGHKKAVIVQGYYNAVIYRN